MPSFDELMTLVPHPGGGWRATITDDWMQGRSSFGGVTAALSLVALGNDVGRDRPLRSIDVAFIGPAGGDVHITTELLRKGRSATHAAATITVDSATAVRTHAVFGHARAAGIECRLPPPQPAAARDSVTPWPFIPGITPTFTQKFEFRATEGDPPFSGSSRPTMGGYIRFVERPTPALTVEAMVALSDAWPGAMMPMGTKPFPASTVRLSAQILETPPDDFTDDFWFRSDCIAASGGYATVVGRLYAGQTPVLWTEQLVAYFDR